MRRCAVVAALLSGAFPAPSQATQTLKDDEIVIVGETQRQLMQATKAYVKEVGIAVGEKPTARWVDPICPKAIGLSAAQEEKVVRRIRVLIREVGAPLAKEKCAGNLAITFTDAPVDVIKDLRRKGDRALAEVPKQSLDAFISGPAPIRWWYQTDIRSRDGVAASGAVNPALLFACDRCESTDQVNLSQGDKGMLYVRDGSLISTQGMRTIAFAGVLIDVTKAAGASLDSVIDYAALVGLAEIKMGASPPASILSLFDVDRPVVEMTNRDRAMLTGLYKIQLDRKAEQQQRTLVNAMFKGVLDPDRKAEKRQ
jgi:hypothetical protein